MTSKKNKLHSFQGTILIVYVVFCCKGSLWQLAEKCPIFSFGHDYNLLDCSICNCGWLQSNVLWTLCHFFNLNFTKQLQNMHTYCHEFCSKRCFYRTPAKGVLICIRSLKHLMSFTLNRNLSFFSFLKNKWVTDGFLPHLIRHCTKKSKAFFWPHKMFFFFFFF